MWYKSWPKQDTLLEGGSHAFPAHRPCPSLPYHIWSGKSKQLEGYEHVIINQLNLKLKNILYHILHTFSVLVTFK